MKPTLQSGPVNHHLPHRIRIHRVSATRPVAPKPLKVVPETLLIGQYRYVAHAMIPANPADTCRPCRHGIFLKPACGRPMKASLGKVVEEIFPDMQLCQHAD